MKDDIINRITDGIKAREKRAQKPVIANVSNRHIHLCEMDMERLFGKGYKLTKKKDLIQPGQYACNETISIRGEKREIKNVRVLGPLRKNTQVEISKTDAFVLGVNAPLRISGDIKGSAALTLIGPAGTIKLAEGCIIAKRHIHFAPEDAEFYGIKDSDIIKVKCLGERGLVFDNVVARVSKTMALEFHIDTDEANASGITNGDKVIIL